MRLEYFEMIDSVVRLDRDAGRIDALAHVPATSPVFEGHFPRLPARPRRAAHRDHGAGLGLPDPRTPRFRADALPHGGRQGPLPRSFVGPGVSLEVSASLEHDGSGYAVTRAAIRHAGKPLCDAELRFRTMPFPDGLDAPDAGPGARDRAFLRARRYRETARSSSPGSGSSPARVRGSRRISGRWTPTTRRRRIPSGSRPHPVHPAPAIAWDGQIPKKSDQRQMEAWQRLGVYAAGLALDAAGAKDDAAFKQALHLVVAAGGGERDYAVDGAILTGPARRGRPRRLPQRAPAERPSADALPGAAFEPARGQHRHRPRGDRGLAHLHGRRGGGGGRAADRPGADRLGADRGDSSRRGPTAPNGRTCW